MSHSPVTLGADPEFFITDNSRRPVPICGMLGGTKGVPIRMSADLDPGFTLQEDNVMVEFNVPPTSSLNTFVTQIQSATTFLTEKIKGMGYLPSYHPEMKFPKSRLKHPQAAQFGCSPDFNAHESGQVFPKIDIEQLAIPNFGQWRFAGGHVHIGYKADVPDFVAASFADLFIGLRMAAMDPQNERRKYYGQPGRYRPTSYGIEYRTLSNFWIWDYGYLCEVGGAAHALGEYLQQTDITMLRTHYQNVPWLSVQDAIRMGDSNIANQIRQFLSSELNWEI